jgi:hypothetical protein
VAIKPYTCSGHFSDEILTSKNCRVLTGSKGTSSAKRTLGTFAASNVVIHMRFRLPRDAPILVSIIVLLSPYEM